MRCHHLKFPQAEMLHRYSICLTSSTIFSFLCLLQVLSRLQDVAAKESVSYDVSGLEAIVFVAEGDMRNALNSMQSTVSGFGTVSSESVFKVRTWFDLFCLICSGCACFIFSFRCALHAREEVFCNWLLAQSSVFNLTSVFFSKQLKQICDQPQPLKIRAALERYILFCHYYPSFCCSL